MSWPSTRLVTVTEFAACTVPRADKVRGMVSETALATCTGASGGRPGRLLFLPAEAPGFPAAGGVAGAAELK
ncbi:hypothetical protein TUM12149_22090 [Morganella morganii]|nr:hypothetical protein TUM12149_22090 [Morganella morganii]